MKYDGSDNRVFLTAEELSHCAYQRENATLLMEKFGFRRTSSKKAADERQTDGITPVDGVGVNIPLEKEFVYGDLFVTVSSVADSISYDGSVHTIEKLITVPRLSPSLSPFSNPDHFAETAVNAALFAETNGVNTVVIRMTFLSNSAGESVSFTAAFSRVALERMLETLLNRALPFIQVYADSERLFPIETKKMPFPYHTIREGQAEFIQYAYRAIRRGTSLLVSAPTGIGKTMSAIFSAVKSVGEGYADKIFYLTAKTITGQAAMEAARRITKYAPHFRTCMICSKDQVCTFKKKFRESGQRINCRFCELTESIREADSATFVSCRERELSALTELLSSDDPVYTTDRIRDAAARYSVCPYALSLALSESCTMVVCDYNYVLDDGVRLKQYFKNPLRHDRYVFLFDEAHNMPDRVRDTYSASLSSDLLDQLNGLTETAFPDDTDLGDRVKSLTTAFEAIRGLCRENESLTQNEAGEEVSCGFCDADAIPPGLLRACDDLSRLLGRYIRDRHESADLIQPIYDALSQTSFAGGYFDEHFRFFASHINGRVTAEILCVDPAGLIRTMLSSATSSILFSATLSPSEYFRELTGLPDADILELESPYDPENLCLVAYDSISTRLSDRRSTIRDCAEVIVETVAAQAGNYIVYFPSYDYMQRVCRVFARMSPGCDLVMQKQGMSYRERERFINLFSNHKDGTLVGFCVLGGMFSEGIDLPGDSLIGAIVVGTGMPQISAERNIMAAYYQNKTEEGYNFAYTCPGINKVLQAAGRVIRSENDHGVIVLIDDRLNDPNMKHLFPTHWRHMRYTGDLVSLHTLLDRFWNRK